jgi:hypothetical protein
MKMIIAAAFAVLFAMPVTAQQGPCGDRETVVAALKKAGATVRLEASAATVAFEFWARDNGEWIYLGTNVQGISCIIAAGDFFSIPEPAPRGEAG